MTMNKQEKVLLYNIKDEKLMRLCDSMQIKWKMIQDCELNQTLEELLDFDKLTTGEKILTDFKMSFLFMADMDEKRMDELSQRMRQEEIRFDGIKAVLTSHNKNWSVLHLFDEISKDHAYFKAFDDLKMYMRLSSNYKKESNSDIWSDYQRLLMEAFMMLNSQTSFEEVQIMNKKLKEISEKLK